MKLFLGLFLLCFSCASFAQVEVMFLRVKQGNGQFIEMEPGGKFAHVLVSYNGKWIHAHPSNGVELVADPLKFGTAAEILVHPELNEPKPELVREVLGKPYSLHAPWEDRSAFGCSKFAGHLFRFLGVKPSIMRFEAAYWKQKQFRNLKLPVGQLGLSPDDLYGELRGKGFSSKASFCRGAILNL